MSVITEINRNFLIRYKETDMKKTGLIGAGRYKILVSEEIANKHFLKALNGGKDKYTFKLRGRLTVNFLSK